MYFYHKIQPAQPTQSVMKFWFLSLFVFFCTCSYFERPPQSPQELERTFHEIEQITDVSQRRAKAHALWSSLKQAGKIPFTHDSTVVFIYYGEAESVKWNGDFNSWGENTAIQISGKNITGTDLWYARYTFPSDARLDYKIVRNDNEWILDPANPHQQWSGFGPNSELRMPRWQEEPLTHKTSGAESGTLGETELISSKHLGYTVSYRVYTPAGYASASNLNVIYVTDGQEYADEQMGSMINVLDNLHSQNAIQPTVAVFVSPLSVEDENINRRAEEFANNPAYLNFYAEELIPTVESNYNISGTREHRAILGTSLGGLTATYFAFSRPDLFQHIGIQAPAYWYREEIYDLVKKADFPDPNIFMSVGTIGDNTIDARLMKTIFEQKGYTITYREVNESHSWGAWRSQLDDILITFFGK